jgi:hypothetical protein
MAVVLTVAANLQGIPVVSLSNFKGTNVDVPPLRY